MVTLATFTVTNSHLIQNILKYLTSASEQSKREKIVGAPTPQNGHEYNILFFFYFCKVMYKNQWVQVLRRHTPRPHQ